MCKSNRNIPENIIFNTEILWLNLLVKVLESNYLQHSTVEKIKSKKP